MLALGGKAPLLVLVLVPVLMLVLVLGDADIGAGVVAATSGAFANPGQICMSTERIVVDARIADALVAGLKARAAALTVGETRVMPQPTPCWARWSIGPR